MNAASFIDIVLTPLGGGIGAFLGVSWAARRQPETFEHLSKLGPRIAVGATVAAFLFALKLF